MPTQVPAETIQLYAAGSLKAALTDVAKAFELEKGGNVRVEITFGASGLLRERIEKGERAHVFASADLGHPQKLAAQGLTAAPVRIFARNELCAIVREGLDVKTANLLDFMLDEKVRLGTSSPKADPSGDYAFSLFAKADAKRPGALARLEGKALKLTGSATSPKAPEGHNLYAWVMTSNQADIFLTYCTNAFQAKAQASQLSVVGIPNDLSVSAEYGLAVLKNAPPEAAKLAGYFLSSKAKKILADYGFGEGD